MGQYWKVVNLDKKEYVNPHILGTGLKLWEQLANHPGTGAALVILCAAMPEARGGGDFDLDQNWHGPEREAAMKAKEIDGCTPGPMPEEYMGIAKRTIGRWAGDRVVLIGDYTEDEDLVDSSVPASKIYGLCHEFLPSEHIEDIDEISSNPANYFRDISLDVYAVIEHELQGKYVGDGWRHFESNHEEDCETEEK
jgi:hypothetical protein